MGKRVRMAAVVAALALVPATVAMASSDQARDSGANNKEGKGQHDYEADAGANAGIDPLGLGLITTGSSSDGHTDGDGTDANASAGGVAVLGVTVVDGVACSSSKSGDLSGGVEKDSAEDSLLDVPAGPVHATVLGSSCDTHATKSNNAHADSQSTVVAASVDGLGSVDVIDSQTQTRTTSGQANSSGTSTLLGAEIQGNELTVVSCSSTSTANNGGEETVESFTLVEFGGEALDVPAPCLIGAADSDADYRKK